MSTPENTMSATTDRTELIAEAKRAAYAIYIATDEVVADDVSRIIRGLIDALVQSEQDIAAAKERERVLLDGVRELVELMSPEATIAATVSESSKALPVDAAFIADVAEYTMARTAKVRSILSGLLPSTTNETIGGRTNEDHADNPR